MIGKLSSSEIEVGTGLRRRGGLLDRLFRQIAGAMDRSGAMRRRYDQGFVLRRHYFRVAVRTEQQVRLLSQAIEQCPESILITNLQGHIDCVNEAFTRITGYSRLRDLPRLDAWRGAASRNNDVIAYVAVLHQFAGSHHLDAHSLTEHLANGTGGLTSVSGDCR